MTSKSLLRTEARARRAALARALPDFAQRIAAFADTLALAPGAVIAGYWPVQSEADPRALMAVLAARGHVLALPRIAAKGEALHFHRWREGDALFDNHYGIVEPSADAQRMMPDVILVPLLAFDASGHRLGYGGGYYDRSLFEGRATVPPANPLCRGPVLAIGIAYAGQLVPSLPHESHDRTLDAILTENGLFKPA
jgi:5-formyltetrahydrofolate cyclo-ligase